jgi:hypothetical protein
LFFHHCSEEDNNQGPGHPRKIVNQDELERLLHLNIPICEIAKQLCVARSTIYNSIAQYGINYERFSRMSQADIEREVELIMKDHPNAGEVMVQGHLTSRGLQVQRQAVRRAIHAVDPDGEEERKRKPIRRRVYRNPFPNFVWHIDGNHKLVRWRLVIHHAIDGFSRMVAFARCSSNNRAETNHDLFLQALPKYGRPSKVRTDLGGEIVDIWRDMTTFWGESNIPVLVGKSVHNQRIEWHNRALNEQFLSTFRQQFYELESQGALDVNNDTDIFCLHCVYLPRINKALDEFVAAHNSHRISTENNRTPKQLFRCNTRLADYYEGIIPQHPNQSEILKNLIRAKYQGEPHQHVQYIQRTQSILELPDSSSCFINNEKVAKLTDKLIFHGKFGESMKSSLVKTFHCKVSLYQVCEIRFITVRNLKCITILYISLNR